MVYTQSLCLACIPGPLADQRGLGWEWYGRVGLRRGDCIGPSSPLEVGRGHYNIAQVGYQKMRCVQLHFHV